MESPEQTSLSVTWLIAEWSEKMCGIVESMADVRPTLGRTETPADVVAPLADTPVWRQTFAINEEPGLWIASPHSTALELGRRTLAAAGVDTSDENDAQNTFTELLQQSLSALGQSIGTHLNCDSAASGGEQLEDVPAGLEWFSVRLEFAGTPLDPFWLSFAPWLLTRLAGASAGNAAQPISLEDANFVPEPATPPGGGRSKTFDLLLDVALPVSISFGRTFLPIKDVLKLTTGSIVELDRGVNEPVDVIVNNCVIARGEVVVVEGNYGVRILQIASRYERLRTGSASSQVQHALMGN